MSSEVKQLPDGSTIEKKFVRDYTKGMQQALMDVGFWQCCFNCHEFRENHVDFAGKGLPLYCNRYNCTPPCSVLPFGCDTWLINKQPPF